jgi:hypothetical protein
MTVKYSKPGIQPPIYLAGSFSDPAWHPQEMQYTADENNEYNFHAEVTVEEDKQYQYKFRVGPGDWWMLNEDAPTATDNMGNRNNVLSAPVQEAHNEESQSATEESQTVTEQPLTNDISSVHTLAVEKADSEPRHGDDFGAEATFGQKDAHELRSQDAEADCVVVKPEPHTSELADVAAEVADSAVIIDREIPTPPISDEEAGRIGYRRMSLTPIPQVADTAAEVADSAATLDKDDMLILQLPPFSSALSTETPKAGNVTPWQERAPLFAHECLEPHQGEAQDCPHETFESTTSNEEARVDIDDPSLEDFPHDRTSIIEQVRTMETRLSEDETAVDGVAPSPVVGANHHVERLEFPTLSPSLLAEDRLPSLDSIAEEHLEHKDDSLTSLPNLAKLNEGNGRHEFTSVGSSEDEDEGEAIKKQEREPSVDIQEIALEIPISVPSNSLTFETAPAVETPEAASKVLKPIVPVTGDRNFNDGESYICEIAASDEGPSITVQPATPGSSTKTRTSDPFPKVPNTAKSTAISEEPIPNLQLRMRASQQSPSAERPFTPTSMRSAGKDAKSKNFLKAFWRVVFVDWIGGLIAKFCGGGRHTLLAIFALVIITIIAPALYFFA